MGGICGDKKKAKKDEGKSAKLQAKGERFYVCGKCGRTSHKESHLCKPKKG